MSAIPSRSSMSRKAGPPELVCISTGNGMYSLNLASGKENWAVADAFAMRTVGSPVLAGGLLFGSTGSGAYAGQLCCSG